MARKRSQSRRPTAHRFPIASRRLVRPVVRLRPWPVSLRPLEDRRSWWPSAFRPAAVVGARAARRISVRPDRPFRDPVLRFAVPRKVVLCLRRERRREVLFAKDKVRSGRGGSKRRNEWSAISCR